MNDIEFQKALSEIEKDCQDFVRYENTPQQKIPKEIRDSMGNIYDKILDVLNNRDITILGTDDYYIVQHLSLMLKHSVDLLFGHFNEYDSAKEITRQCKYLKGFKN